MHVILYWHKYIPYITIALYMSTSSPIQFINSGHACWLQIILKFFTSKQLPFILCITSHINLINWYSKSFGINIVFFIIIQLIKMWSVLKLISFSLAYSEQLKKPISSSTSLLSYTLQSLFSIFLCWHLPVSFLKSKMPYRNCAKQDPVFHFHKRQHTRCYFIILFERYISVNRMFLKNSFYLVLRYDWWSFSQPLFKSMYDFKS